MFCPYCGAPMPDDSNRCSQCGVASYVSHARPRRHLWAVMICILLFLALAAGTAVLLINIFGASGQSTSQPSGGTWFTLNEGVLYFDESKYTGGPVLTVPDAINGQSVTAIGDGCFADCDSLTTIVLPEGIRSIGDRAFAGCNALRGLYVPDLVTYIGQEAFRDCGSFEAIYIPSAVRTVGSDAFDGCYALRYIFYYGDFQRWDALYSEFINPFATAICLDGYYYHGEN